MRTSGRAGLVAVGTRRPRVHVECRGGSGTALHVGVRATPGKVVIPPSVIIRRVARVVEEGEEKRDEEEAEGEGGEGGGGHVHSWGSLSDPSPTQNGVKISVILVRW